MMNSKINNGTKLEFPKLMKSKTTELVVLFKSEGIGTVVHPGIGWRLGEYCKDFDDRTFQEFTGEVVLSN
jgi:hypothetical protein